MNWLSQTLFQLQNLKKQFCKMNKIITPTNTPSEEFEDRFAVCHLDY